MITTQQRSMAIYSAAAVILAVPFIAMQFTKEVDWSLSDFLMMGILLFGTATIIDFVLKKVKISSKRFIYISIAVIVFLLIWAELAVGIFGSPFAGS